MMLTDLDRTLRAAGLTVKVVDGWKTRGRPGDMTTVETITCHHTAKGGAAGKTPSLNTIVNGRPGLPGPLAQLYLAQDGTWYVVAAGKCNHAGVSLQTSFDNSHAIGIEAEADGTGSASDWPEVQMISYARGCKALIERYALTISDVRGHKETCSPRGRKSDPSFDMGAFRRRVASVDLTENEEDMALAPEDITKVAKAVWGVIRELTPADAAAFGGTTVAGQEESINTLLRFPPATARLRREQTEQYQATRERLENLDTEMRELRAVAAQQAALLTDLIARLGQ